MPASKSPMFPNDPEGLYLAIARLTADGIKQAVIAERVGVSQAKVSAVVRGLSDPKAAGPPHLLDMRPRFLSGNLNPAEEIKLKVVDARLEGNTKLCEELSPLNKLAVPFKVHVDPTSGEGSGDTAGFFSYASGVVLRLLEQSRVTGVLWGRSTSSVVDGIRARGASTNVNAYRDFQCIPLCGDPTYEINHLNEGYSATHLAVSLEETLCGKNRRPLPTLHGVPAYISPRFKSRSGNESSGGAKPAPIIVDFISQIPGYANIFGDRATERGLVWSVDTVITSVGVVDLDHDDNDPRDSTGIFMRERLRQENDLKKARLAKFALGDFAGILIPRRDNVPEDRKLVHRYNEGWMGADLDHYHHIQKFSERNGTPGLIVLASDKRKAPLVKKVIGKGLVNHLITTRAVADQLLLA